jgi:hypothetical protein
MVKITNDNFVFKIVTHKAKDILASGIFELYILHNDDSESLIEDLEDLNLALKHNYDIGIEVGQINFYFKTYGNK